MLSLSKISNWFCKKTKKDEDKDKDYLAEFERWISSMKENASLREAFTARFDNPIIYAEATCICNPLSITVYHKKLILEKTKEKTEDACPICLEPIEGEHCKPIVCNHRFHTKCIRETIKHNDECGIITQCPLCRQGPCNNIKEIINEKNEYWESTRGGSDNDSYYDSD